MFIFIASLTFSLDSESARKSLRGIEGFYAFIDFEVEETGLTEKILLTDIELKLRLAGIRVIDKEKRYINKNTADIYLMLLGYPLDNNNYVYHMTLSVLQNAFLERDNSVFLPVVATWSKELIASGAIDGLKKILERI